MIKWRFIVVRFPIGALTRDGIKGSKTCICLTWFLAKVILIMTNNLKRSVSWLHLEVVYKPTQVDVQLKIST